MISRSAPDGSIMGSVESEILVPCPLCGQLQPSDETTCHFCGADFKIEGGGVSFSWAEPELRPSVTGGTADEGGD